MELNSKRSTLRLTITDQGDVAPKVTITAADDEVDITDELVYIRPTLSADGCFVELMVEADVDWTFEVREVTRIKDAPPMTADDYDAIILSGGASQSAGAKIAAHMSSLANGG